MIRNDLTGGGRDLGSGLLRSRKGRPSPMYLPAPFNLMKPTYSDATTRVYIPSKNVSTFSQQLSVCRSYATSARSDLPQGGWSGERPATQRRQSNAPAIPFWIDFPLATAACKVHGSDCWMNLTPYRDGCVDSEISIVVDGDWIDGKIEYERRRSLRKKCSLVRRTVHLGLSVRVTVTLPEP